MVLRSAPKDHSQSWKPDTIPGFPHIECPLEQCVTVFKVLSMLNTFAGIPHKPSDLLSLITAPSRHNFALCPSPTCFCQLDQKWTPDQSQIAEILNGKDINLKAKEYTLHDMPHGVRSWGTFLRENEAKRKKLEENWRIFPGCMVCFYFLIFYSFTSWQLHFDSQFS